MNSLRLFARHSSLFSKRQNQMNMSNKQSTIKQDDNEISQMMGSDFKEAIELANKEQFESSAVYFQKMTKQLEQQERVSPKVLEIIYKKYSVVLKQLDNQSRLVEVLQQLYFVVESMQMSMSTKSSVILQNLLRETMVLDPRRALMFVKYLQEEQEQKLKLDSYRGGLYPYFGLIYSVNGELEKGIEMMEEGLKVISNGQMKGLLMNNLTVCQYELSVKNMMNMNGRLQSEPSNREYQEERRQMVEKIGIDRQKWLAGYKNALNQYECLDPSRQSDIIEKDTFIQTKLLTHPIEHSLMVEQFNLNEVTQNIGLLLVGQGEYEEGNIWLRVTQQESQKRWVEESYLSILHLGLVLLEKDIHGLYGETGEALLLTALEAAPHGYGRVKCLTAYVSCLKSWGRTYEGDQYQQQIDRLIQESNQNERHFYTQNSNLYDHLVVPPFIHNY